ncbi:N5-glutamine S-adenosyl-L-methionine-dependent methyltransferase [compost metagenome]
MVGGASTVLRPEGLLALEVGAGQANAVATLIEARGEYRDVGIRRDLAGKERVVVATLAAMTNDGGG